MALTDEQKEFIAEYAKKILNNSASVFVGSGLSRTSGYTGWADLLKKHAIKLGLDVKRERDLISLAQYVVNKHDEKELKEYTCKVFARGKKDKDGAVIVPNENHYLLSALPIRSFWTTNYDTLIEQALEYRDLKFNKIVTDADLRSKDNDKENPVWLFKMHGDVGYISDNWKTIVLTKQDYENYYDDYEMTIAKLKSEICVKTFLFIGYSITDPNVMHILARARKVFDKKNGRTHYAIMKKPEQFNKTGKKRREYEYENNKLNHQIRDFEEYGIKVILVDSYEQITEMLRSLLDAVRAQNVLLSGSFENETKNSASIGDFARGLAFCLTMNNYRLFSGYGKGIGQFIVSGAFEGCEKLSSAQDFAMNTENKFSAWGDLPISDKRVLNNFNNRVYLFPFPHDIKMNDGDREKLYARLRENMVVNTRVAIFICGEKYKNGNDNTEGLILADGVQKEHTAAKDNGCFIVPVACFGGAAKQIWEKMSAIDNKFTGSTEFKELNDPAKALSAVQRIIANINSGTYEN